MQVITFDDLRSADKMAEAVFIRAAMSTGGVDPTPDGKYSLEFSIQGREVDFKAFCQAFGRHWEAAVVAAAKERLRQAAGFSQLFDKLLDMEREACQKIDDMMSEWCTPDV